MFDVDVNLILLCEICMVSKTLQIILCPSCICDSAVHYIDEIDFVSLICAISKATAVNERLASAVGRESVFVEFFDQLIDDRFCLAVGNAADII